MSTDTTRQRKIIRSPAAKTRQEPKDSTDINRIVAAARRGIEPTWINRRMPVYADMTDVPKDLTEAYNKIKAAEEAFLSLPSECRRDIDNDPRRLPAWLRDPANRQLAEKHGLLTPSPASPAPTGPASGSSGTGGAGSSTKPE